MRIGKHLAVCAAAVVAMTGAVTVSAAQPAAADFDACDLRVKLAELNAWDAEDQYNIIVWKDSAKESAHFNGVVEQGHTVAGECDNVVGEDADFFWAIFEDGEFTRKGDGGYRNWAFRGHFERDGNHVQFLSR